MLSARPDRSPLVVAIQPDDAGPTNSSSPRWAEFFERAGHIVRTVNVFASDILEQLQGADGFMWRYAHHTAQRQIAARLLPVIEHELGLAVYPCRTTAWHFDDKIAQCYLFAAHGIPAPRTWVWFDRQLARDGVRDLEYPLVLKLQSGAGSANVRLLRSPADAFRWIDRLFGRGVRSCDEVDRRTRHLLRSWRTRLRSRVRGGYAYQEYMNVNEWSVEKGYVLVQEFLPGNSFDTRVTVIGDRAFGFRRFNRDGDFRASGSGRLDTDPSMVARDFVELAFDVARKLDMQSCAIDGLRRGGEAVVAEASYTYVSSAVHACPGHWTASGEWRPGQMWPESAQAADFLALLLARRRGSHLGTGTLERRPPEPSIAGHG